MHTEMAARVGRASSVSPSSSIQKTPLFESEETKLAADRGHESVTTWYSPAVVDSEDGRGITSSHPGVRSRLSCTLKPPRTTLASGILAEHACYIRSRVSSSFWGKAEKAYMPKRSHLRLRLTSSWLFPGSMPALLSAAKFAQEKFRWTISSHSWT